MSSYQEKAVSAGADLTRLAVGQKFLASGRTVQLLKLDDQLIVGLAEKENASPYKFTIDFTDILKSTCICGMYLANKNGGIERRDKLCSHQIAGLIVADKGKVTITAPSKPVKAVVKLGRSRKSKPADQGSTSSPSAIDPDDQSVDYDSLDDQGKAKRSYSFKSKLHRSIGDAIQDVTDVTKRIITNGQHPILVGSTGCGKTSAVEQLIKDNKFWFDYYLTRYGTEVDQLRAGSAGMYYETIGGMPSYGDADLFGLKMQGEPIKGILVRAFERARNGEKVVIFLDEFKRFDQRVQNALMIALLPKSKETAAKLGINYDGDIYLAEAPVWGQEWAPVENIIWVLGTNEWGAPIDPALARRVQATYINYNPAILKHLDPAFAQLVIETWKMCDAGMLPLPMEYGFISRMKHACDVSKIPDYLCNLRLVDRSYQVMIMNLIPDALKQRKGFSLPLQALCQEPTAKAGGLVKPLT